MEEINTKIIGVDGQNEDGQYRQVIISKYVIERDTLELEHEPSDRDKNSIAAYYYPGDDQKLKVGFINPTLAPRIIAAIDEGKLLMCMVMNVTGRDSDKLGLECYISISTHDEIETEKKTQIAIIKKERAERRYGIGKWRAIIGIVLLIMGLSSLAAVSGDPSILFATAIFIVPAVILLLPWERWLFDQITKMFARKH